MWRVHVVRIGVDISEHFIPEKRKRTRPPTSGMNFVPKDSARVMSCEMMSARYYDIILMRIHTHKRAHVNIQTRKYSENKFIFSSLRTSGICERVIKSKNKTTSFKKVFYFFESAGYVSRTGL